MSLDQKEFKLITPPDNTSVTDRIKAMYLCDSYFTGNVEAAEEEKEMLEATLRHCFGTTPSIILIGVREALDFSIKRDILLYDWGGISALGSRDGMVSFCKTLIEEAENHPTVLFIMASRMTEWAMEDALEAIPHPPANVLVSIGHAVPLLRALFKEKGVSIVEDLEITNGYGLPGGATEPPTIW